MSLFLLFYRFFTDKNQTPTFIHNKNDHVS